MTAGNIIVLIAILVVAAILGVGLYSLFRGGDFARTNSNKLMRLRIVAQLVAIIIILAVLYFTGRGPQ
jgi:heme/copper-type cytochrome/quinol oxidase subunit 2